MRKWRKTHPLIGEARKKANARHYALSYLNRGKIIKKPCEIANCLEKTQMHHDNYDKPLEVRWFCRKHHLEFHYSLTH